MLRDRDLLVVALALVVLTDGPRARLHARQCALVALGVAAFAYARRLSTTARLTLADADDLNEVLLVESSLNGAPHLFLVDTGYAGPPVLSSSYLAAATGRPAGTARDEYRRVQTLMRSGVSADARARAVKRLVHDSDCLSYTSGCAMRLLSIGDVQMQQADMVMCPMLKLRNIFGCYVDVKRAQLARADVFVTNPLHNCVHILTSDFLLHAAPCVISTSRGELQLHLSALEHAAVRPTYTMLPPEMHGGAFVVKITVGGVALRLTLDTGAPGPIAIGTAARARLGDACRPTGHRLTQRGVNGERLCTEVEAADVEFCGAVHLDCRVFVIDANFDRLDGYVGLGFLRAFDMLLARDGVGFRPSGLGMRRDFGQRRGACGRAASRA